MPSCNLTKTVQNKWLQASGIKGGDLYIAAMDDYIRAFLQVVTYYQYLKGGVGGMGPSKKEFKLRSAQRCAQHTSDPGVIQSALLGMPEADEFCTCNPHHEGAEVFGSQKQKPDTSIEADENSHMLNTINFSRPRPPKRVTRSHATTLPTIVEEVEGSVEQVHSSPPSETNICHITAVQKSTVNERTWHIACVPKTSAKACWTEWLSQRSALHRSSFMERTPMLQLTPAYGKISGSIVKCTCNSSLALTTLKSVSRVHVISGSFHIPIL